MPPGAVFKLSQILDECGWKDVMAIIPSDPLDLSSKPKYKVEHIRLIESYAEKHSKSYTELLLQEWGTSGKVRATLRTLLDVLIKAELFRAADYVAEDLLQLPSPERPSRGPAAKANVHLADLTEVPVLPIVPEKTLINVPYTLLYSITNNFSDEPFHEHETGHVFGHKLGAGAFGSVYYGVMPDGSPVAVKKLMNDTAGLFKQFQTEITILSTYRHPNLLPLLGASYDGPFYCLVYEFMPNRSLQDRLCAKIEDCVLDSRKRLDIAVGVCRGLHYLHTAETPLIHRDVKTANILLDGTMNARLGDFGLVRTSPTDSRMTSTVFGTSAYMAPEAFRGDVSVKTDVFSMGVVLLELLTALPPYDSTREGADIVTFVDEAVDDSIEPLLDPSAGWDISEADRTYHLAQLCLEDKKKRPLIGQVIDSLTAIIENVSHT